MTATTVTVPSAAAAAAFASAFESDHISGDCTILFSGGLDSTSTLALAIAENPGRKFRCVTVQYGSKHNNREIKAARRVVKHYLNSGVDITIDVSDLTEVFSRSNSALLKDSTALVPLQTYNETQQAEGVQSTTVPFRNGLLLAYATVAADINNSRYLYVGVHAGDSHNDHYADCSKPFIDAMASAILIGTYCKILLRAPFVSRPKEYVCAAGIAFHAPFSFTYSCYLGGQFHCGRCATCQDRINAFVTNNRIDPVHYVYEPIWDMRSIQYPY